MTTSLERELADPGQGREGHSRARGIGSLWTSSERHMSDATLARRVALDRRFHLAAMPPRRMFRRNALQSLARTWLGGVGNVHGWAMEPGQVGALGHIHAFGRSEDYLPRVGRCAPFCLTLCDDSMNHML